MGLGYKNSNQPEYYHTTNILFTYCEYYPLTFIVAMPIVKLRHMDAL